MTDRIEQGLIDKELTEDNNEDELVEGLVEETNSEVVKKNTELEILTNQVQAIYQNPEAAEVLRLIDEDEETRHLLHYPERIFVESYCRDSHIFVPTQGKAASMKDLALFYHYVPISPELFQESIVEKMFDVEFKEKANSEERLRERAAHFELLRKTFALLKPLPFTNKFKRGRNRINRIFVSPINEARGKLVITRMAPGRRVNSVYQDVYGAYRAHLHILNGYDGTISEDDIQEMGEFKAILNLTDKVQYLIAFIQRWKGASKQEKSQMEQLLVDAEDLLANCQNQLKVNAHEKAADSLNFTDSRGQINPCATAPKLLVMGKNLFARLDDILSIRSKISEDKGVLDTIIQPIHNIFYSGSLELKTILGQQYFQPVDPEEIKSYGRVKYECAGINKQLSGKQGFIAELEKIAEDKHMPAPFVQYAQAICSNFDVVKMLNQYIDQNKNRIDSYMLRDIHDEVCRYAIIGFIAIKYQYIHRKYHEILTRILEDPLKVDFDEERRRLNGLSVRLRPHEYEQEFEFREDLKINLQGLPGLFEHIQYISAKITKYKRIKIKIDEELLSLEKAVEKGTATEEDIDKINKLKTKLVQITVAFKGVVRLIMKEFDFNELIKEATVDDPKALFEAIISQTS